MSQKMSPKATIIWCAIILFFSLITFYYGGIDAFVASALSTMAIVLSFMCLKEIKERKVK
jgi:hypothetical protein